MIQQQYPSQLLEKAVAEFAKLPGIGRKTALRLVLNMLRRDMALASAELGEVDRAFSELEEMCEHLIKLEQFVAIDHTSPLVKGLHYEASQVSRSDEETYANAFLRQLEQNPRFACLHGDTRFDGIREKLRKMA